MAALLMADTTCLNAQAPAAAAQSAPAASPASPTDLVGVWQGTLHIPQANRDLRIEIKVSKADAAGYKTAFYSIDQGGQPIAGTKTTLENGNVTFGVDAIGGKYEGKMSADGKTINGTWTQGPNPLALNLERTTPEAAWPIPEPVKPMAADANPGFDVVTVKPSQPGAQGKGFGFQGTHFRTFNTNMNDLVAFAYGMHTKQIVGAPDWFGTDLFDIDGKPDVEGQPSLHQMEEMVQKLLPDRFALKFHHEQRELPVYIVTVAPGGPKMKTTTAGPNDPQGFGFRGLGDLIVRNMNMKEFASWMQSGVMDKPVVDHTGLTDKYDFTLKWTPDDSQFAQFRGVGAVTPPGAGSDPNAPPSLYTAMPETLGLKMEAGKAMDDVIVIDHVEKPAAN
ncbi:MAG: TIGR03435 family protein [Terracidiphilus sp.]|jgi:uncharacterized protein (TIGR03435 family)